MRAFPNERKKSLHEWYKKLSMNLAMGRVTVPVLLKTASGQNEAPKNLVGSLFTWTCLDVQGSLCPDGYTNNVCFLSCSSSQSCSHRLQCLFDFLEKGLWLFCRLIESTLQLLEQVIIDQSVGLHRAGAGKSLAHGLTKRSRYTMCVPKCLAALLCGSAP